MPDAPNTGRVGALRVSFDPFIGTGAIPGFAPNYPPASPVNFLENATGVKAGNAFNITEAWRSGDPTNKKPPLIVRQFLSQVPLPGRRWIASSLTVRMLLLIKTASFFAGSENTWTSLSSQLAFAEIELATLIKAANEAEVVKIRAENLQKAKPEEATSKVVNEAKTALEQAIATVRAGEANLQKIKKEQQEFLVGGAEQEDNTFHGAPTYYLAIRLPGGRSQYIELKDAIVKKIGKTEAGTVAATSSSTGRQLGFAESEYVLEYNQVVQLIVPIEIDDSGQPVAEFSVYSPDFQNEGGFFLPGNFTSYAELGISDLFLNYAMQ